MKKNWNNKGRINLCLMFLTLSSLLLALCLILPDDASSGPYLDSAHGNNQGGDTGYGVKRSATGFPTDYARGNCAHCHEQHASIDGAEPQPDDGGPSKWLLASAFLGQMNIFCYNCHTETNQLQDPTAPMNQQYNYSHLAGGDLNTCPNNINRAFVYIDGSGIPRANNCGSSTGSSHFLLEIANFLKNKWGFGSTAGNINPCSGCHNPHKAQRQNYPVGSKGTSPISLPSTHNGDWNVYGDDTNERMNFNYPLYQAPYYFNSFVSFEPDGNLTSDGSNLPDYVTFCTDCHNTSYNNGGMTSEQVKQFRAPFGPAWIQNPDWATNPHGGADANMDTRRKEPYKSDQNYILSCTDCHEPHGSPNRLLIREEINGESTVTFTTWNDKPGWLTICQRCHDRPANWWNNHQGGQTFCAMCHMHDPNWFRPI